MKKRLLGLAVLMSLTLGCGQVFQGENTGYTSGVQTAKAISRGYQLYIGPEAGETPVLNLISNAQKNVDLSIYLLTNQSVITALCAAAKRGVDVRVILERNPFNPENPDAPLQVNVEASKTLTKAGVRVGWSDPAFNFNHSKYMVLDRSTALVTTSNFTNSGLNKNREMGVLVQDSKDVSELQKIFNGDWTHSYYKTSDPHLVVSPDNSRGKLLGMISKATKTIRLEVEVFSDFDAIKVLSDKAAQGVDVQVLLAEPSRVSSNGDVGKQLLASKIAVKYQIDPFLHAKAVVVDDKTAYIGSINFTRSSMDRNREIGLMLEDVGILNTLKGLWDKDWSKATNPENYVPTPKELSFDD